MNTLEYRVSLPALGQYVDPDGATVTVTEDTVTVESDGGWRSSGVTVTVSGPEIAPYYLDVLDVNTSPFYTLVAALNAASYKRPIDLYQWVLYKQALDRLKPV